MTRNHPGKTTVFRSLVLLVCTGLMWGGAPAASGASTPRVPRSALAADVMHLGEPRVEARLVLHPDDDPASGSVRAGVLLDIESGWHVYWRNPGESGLPTRVEFEAPGSSVGPIQWPAPRVYEEADGLFTTYGYEERVLLGSRIDLSGASDAGSPGADRLGASVELLACRNECVPGTFALSTPLEAGTAFYSETDRELVRSLFAEAERRQPVAPGSLGARLEVRYDREAVRPAETFRAQLRLLSCADGGSPPAGCALLAPALSSHAFQPASEELALGFVGQASLESSAGFVVEVEGQAPGRAPRSDERLQGVLAVRDQDGVPHALAVDVPFFRAEATAASSLLGADWRDAPPTAMAGAPAPSPASPALWRALLLGLLGGLILNLMPCVLPVLAIKVVSVAEMAQHDRREVLAHGAAYAVGVLASMWVLAGVVIAMRAAGSLVGWGFQFQEPLFVLAVCTVVVTFALNLFGVFEVGGPTGRVTRLGAQAVGWRRSLFEGLLAVVLATPCTAPFLGTAVGFAFSSPAPVIGAIFTAVGIGLASPFVAVSLVPGWSRFVPRAGAWMLHLRTGLGFALLASAVWLLWIAGRSLGTDGVVLMLGFLVAVAFGVWVFGQLQRAHMMGWARGFAAGLLVFAVAAPLLVRLEPAPADASQDAHGIWTPYDARALGAELEAGRPAFVVFTADWCITCKVNERAVIADEAIQTALRDLDFAVFRADWTRRDDAIRAELARFGRAGVPLYLVYRPGEPAQPVMLPELLSVDGLRAALHDAAGARATAGSGAEGTRAGT
ncbi:MAG: protein-disulfide reductase DsbD family protein [Myxococcota bacterium]